MMEFFPDKASGKTNIVFRKTNIVFGKIIFVDIDLEKLKP